ncbi:MAG TPA: cbb3-type cytochrome c oxidase subunit I, partial [Longimicrobiales bacterium]|nr:cbb3-type cytochrome c oxidase subunit I [Longimicrobiales bacterium]
GRRAPVAEATTAAPQPARTAPPQAPPSYLRQGGLRSWLLTRDHKRIGLLYLAATTFFLALGGSFALLMRLELLTPAGDLVSSETYNRLFTLHGVVMVWLFMIPSIPAAFGNFFLPLMVGARDVAFPRLNLASFWIYVVGALIVLEGVVSGAADTGWTFYAPFSAGTPTAVTTVALGVFVLGFSTIATGINFIVTVHTMRAAGLGWMQLPVFVWTIYATSIIQVLATPVLGITLVLVAADHLFGLGMFNPVTGGDPLLYQHLFWFYSHPAVYIMILPAMGVMAEVVSAFSQKNPYTYRGLVVSSLGIALVGFISWGHHMFVTGMSVVDVGAFGLLSMAVAVFSAIKVFSWVGTMYRGSISLRTPMLYFFQFLFLFGVGGTTGVALASTSLDMHWHDTYFVVAHFHFIMVGGTLTGFLAALHYWWPKMFGRRYPEPLAVVASVLVILGFLGTFVPQFLLGNLGMPRRYHAYPPRFQPFHVVSTVGSWSLAAGMGLVLLYLAWSLLRGRPSPDNPWRSRGFEWDTASPPPPHNFEEPPSFHGRHPHDYYAPPRRRPGKGGEAGAGKEGDGAG